MYFHPFPAHDGISAVISGHLASLSGQEGVNPILLPGCPGNAMCLAMEPASQAQLTLLSCVHCAGPQTCYKSAFSGYDNIYPEVDFSQGLVLSHETMLNRYDLS